MRGIHMHPVAWVVLKLRYTSVVGLMVLPSAYYLSHTTNNQRGRPHNHHPLSNPVRVSDHPFGAVAPMATAARLDHLPTSTTALHLSPESDNNNDPTNASPSRVQKTVAKVKSFLQTGKSFFWQFPLRKTELEAALPTPTLNETSQELMSKESLDSTTSTTISSFSEDDLPKGTRWAVAHPTVNFTGTWAPQIDADFQQEYDDYLQSCGTSYVFRQICLNFAGTTRERIDQVDQGRTLHFHGQTPAGGWHRSLIASGSDPTQETFEAVHTEFLDPDKELVKVEAWWEDQGTVHKSWLRNKPGVAGGAFESRRYLVQIPNNTADDGDGYDVELICESIFHPAEKDRHNPSSKFKPASVRWRYRRESP